MSNLWKELIIHDYTPIIDGVRVINNGSIQLALVLDKNDRLIGTITDGDVRRGLLGNISLQSPVSKIMVKDPITASINLSERQILNLMRLNNVRQIPVLDDTGKVVDVKTDEMLNENKIDNYVVIMAGGIGSRLKSLTYDTPKPLLHIGEKPILSTIIESFIEYGFHNFIISIGYLGSQLENYFSDGSSLGVNISYVKEDKPLGTAGSLSLLKNLPDRPFLIMNGDILTKLNFRNLLEFHEKHKADATMCVRSFKNQIPYGVIKTDSTNIIKIEEKPIKDIKVNTGIYVVNKNVISLIPHNQFFNMTSLFEKLIKNQKKTVAFPLHEYWIDVGQPSEFEKADKDYKKFFK